MGEETTSERNSQAGKPTVLDYAALRGPANNIASSLIYGCISIGCIPLMCAGLRDNGWFVLGMLALSLLSAIAAIVLGHVERRNTAKWSGTRRRSALVGLSLGYFDIAILLLGIFLLPMMGAVPERANRIKCNSNLQQIGQAMALYAQANNARYPDRFDRLIASGSLATDVFVCPSSNEEHAFGATTQETLARFNTPKCCSYVYLGAGLTTSAPADVVLAYEGLENHDPDGANVLFGDGRVEWFGKAKAQQIVQELKAGKNPPPRLRGLP